MNGFSAPVSKLPWRQKVRRLLGPKESTTASPSTDTSAVATSAVTNVVSSPSGRVASQPPLGQIRSPSNAQSANAVVGQSSGSDAAGLGAGDAQLLRLALQSLEDDERAILETYVSSAASDVQLAVQGALVAAEGKRRACKEKAWSFSFRGRNVVFREEADKLVHWLNRFKAVGDIIANVDPVHIGLPWAGIRVLLEAAIADSKQMAALLIGCEMALYTASRLKTYVEFWRGLPSTLATGNLKESITTMYAHVLRFLAHAIRTYEVSTTRRYLSALWELDEVLNFEKKANDLALKVEIDASNCDRFLASQEQKLISILQSKMETALTDLQQYHQMQISLDQLNLKIDLGRIPYAKGAIFNAFDDAHTLCHPLTRSDLLDQVQTWARQPDSKNIFWLHGAAGAGKSTISWTTAQWLADQRSPGDVDLGASFFFKRGEGDRGSAERFFPTIIRQLILKIPGLDAVIAKKIDLDPFIFDKAIAEQFRRLLLEPLQDPRVQGGDTTLVVVVDALDECEQEIHIQTILELWPQLLRDTPFKLRLFLTSRPELAIRLEFRQMSEDLFRNVDLVDAVPVNTIQHDLSVYLSDTLCSIRDQYNDRFRHSPPLSSSWPESTTIEQLSDMANPLFIVAATVCRFVGDLEFNPRESLEEILATRNISGMSQMELTYLPVLKHLTKGSRDQRHTDKLSQEFRLVIGSIILLAEPLSKGSLATLLKIPPEVIDRRLAPMHSVLRVPSDHHTPIRTLHLSFAEFLLSEKFQQQPFSVDTESTNLMLGKQCLIILSGPDGLCENICGLQHQGQSRHELESSSITQRISSALQYAARYWITHMRLSSHEVHDDSEVHEFMKKHFLHWLEVLSLTNRISEVVANLNVLGSSLSVKSVYLRAFLEDARRFVLANRSIIDLAPLQVYSSAMAFTPRESLVRKIVGRVPTWIRECPMTPERWGSVLQKLEVHQGAATSVAFSPNSSTLASGSVDNTIRLWDAQIGQEIQKLEGHTDRVVAVAFSSDGTTVISCSNDETIRLWDVRTGQEIMELDGYGMAMRAVAISPDNIFAAASPVYGKIWLWNVRTGAAIREMEGHTGSITSLSFSPDGKILASGSYDDTVRLWDFQTGQQTLKLEGHFAAVTAIVFSPDGKILASCSSDATVLAWDLESRRQIQKLDGHTGTVNAVAFSPDGAILASASDDETICIWDAKNWRQVQSFHDHTDAVDSLSFSYDGTILASASGDKTIRLWDMRGLAQTSRFGGHSKAITAIIYSSDGAIVASCSSDTTVRLWDTATSQEIRTLQGQSGEQLHALALSADERVLAAGAEESVELWGFPDGKPLASLEGRYREIRALQFSPDGTILAAGSGDSMIQVWDIRTEQKIREIEGHTGMITTMAFSSDSKLLASASRDLTIKIWDLRTGTQRSELPTNLASRSIKFGTDNKTLITDQGTFNVVSGGELGLELSPDETTTVSPARLEMSGEWIFRDGQKLLWVPQEYRGVSALHGDRLAVGAASGSVGFFRFD